MAIGIGKNLGRIGKLDFKTSSKVKRFAWLYSALILIALTQSTPQSTLARATIKEPIAAMEVVDEVRDGKLFYVSKLLVKAKPERVWQILTDYAHAARIFPVVQECEVIEDHGSVKIAKHVIAPSGLPCTYEYVLRIHESAPHLLEWHRISGDFKELDGSWKLEPIDSGRHTLVTYASHMTGGILEPAFMIRRQFHIDAPMSLTALKHQAEQPNQIASHNSEVVSTQ
jgi:ribosome-associated toxin RatA of RatAB toxin-antitoxin module